jgi:hypothetical protein
MDGIKWFLDIVAVETSSNEDIKPVSNEKRVERLEIPNFRVFMNYEIFCSSNKIEGLCFVASEVLDDTKQILECYFYPQQQQKFYRLTQQDRQKMLFKASTLMIAQ